MAAPGAFEIVDFLSTFVVTAEEDAKCKTPSSSDIISIPNSNAFIDFNCDCMADVFLTR